MGRQSPNKHEISPGTRRAIISWIMQAALGMVGYSLVLVLVVGRWDWLWGWILIGALTAFMAAHPLILMPINPKLLAEREKGIGGKGTKVWDKWVASLAAGVFPIASWVVAGLDTRFHWSQTMHLACHLIGLVIMILGFVLFLWAMASNAFFSEGVRIQEERGHSVATRGPYRWLRHPGYVGAILSQLATPFLLGSVWAFLPTAASAALFILRTYLEDKTLMKELPGYQEYAKKTRYRLLPGVW